MLLVRGHQIAELAQRLTFLNLVVGKFLVLSSCLLLHSWSTSSPRRGRKREGITTIECVLSHFIYSPKQLFQMQLFHRWESWGLEQLHDTEGYLLHTSSLERMRSQFQLTHGWLSSFCPPLLPSTISDSPVCQPHPPSCQGKESWLQVASLSSGNFPKVEL